MNERAILICFIVLTSLTVFSQNEPKKLLWEGTKRQVSSLLSNSSSLTGMVAIDLKSGEKISYNKDVLFPQASAIKIPILMEVFRQAEKGKFSLSDSYPVAAANLIGGSGILRHLDGIEPLSIRNLCILMIVLSDNSATNALIDLVGMESVNLSLKSMDFDKTRLQRKMMNSAASVRGDENLSTPAEAAEILQMIFNKKFLDEQSSEEILAILDKTDREDSRLATALPEDVDLAFKYGVLDGVFTEWAIVFLPERPYAVAVMESLKMGKSENTVEKLSEILYDYYWRLGNASDYGNYIDINLKKD